MKKIKKLGKVAVAALTGATLVGAASANLGDYPQPFVSEDGQINTNIVVGESAKTIDVVGAVNIAGSLGQDAYETTQKSVSGSGSGSWSATNGATLDTRNDQLYFKNSIKNVRQTLTEDQLSVLQTTEAFTGNAEQEVEQYLYVGDQKIEYGNPGDTSDQDPFLYVQNPSSVSTGKNTNSNLYQLQANFQDGVKFNDDSEDDDRNEDVYGEEIQMFGQTFTVSQDSFYGSNSGQLVLYGATETQNVEAGKSVTMTVGGSEVTFTLSGITNSDEAVIKYDGKSKKLEEDESVDVNGEEVRVTTLNNFPPEDSAVDSIDLAVGSEKVILEDGSEVMIGDDEEQVDGTQVSLSGTNTGNGDIDPSGADQTVELSSISIAVGASDSDENYVKAGEPFQDPVFDNLNFRFGGLNPNAKQNGEEIKVEPDGDEDLTASFTSGGDSATVSFFHRDTGSSTNELADEEGDKIVAVEGDAVQEDEYVVTDAGDFSHLWEVTDVSVDTTDLTANGASGDEATVELEDAVSGASVEIDLDADGDGNGVNNDDVYEGTEVIDGQTYHATLDTKDNSDTSTHDLKLTWGTDAGFGATGNTGSGATTAFPTIETDSGARIAFYDPGQNPSGISIGTSLVAFQNTEFFYNGDTGTPAGSNGYSDGDTIGNVINDHDGTLNAAGGDTVKQFTASGAGSARFNDADGSNGYNAGDEVYLDDDNDAVYTGQADTQLAGVTLSTIGAATSVQTSNPWSSAAKVIGFKDGGTANVWESGSDLIIHDEDEDGVYTASSDTEVAPSGTAGSDSFSGSAATGTNGTTLNEFNSSTATNGVWWYDADSSNSVNSGDAIWMENTLDSSADDNSADDGEYDTDTDDTLVMGTAPADNTTATEEIVTGTSNDTVALAWQEDGTSSGFDDNDGIIEESVTAELTLSTGQDPHLAGTGSAPTAGNSLSTSNPWSGATDPVAFVDGGSGSWNPGSENDIIVQDFHAGGTISETSDTQINAGSDGSFGMSDGASATNNDLDETVYFAVDVDGSPTPIDQGDEVIQETKNGFSDGNSLTTFATTTKHTGDQPYDTSESVVDDSDDDSVYDAGETVFGSSAGNVRYWSSDAEETNGVSGLTGILPTNNPALVVIEEDGDDDVQESYTVSGTWDGAESYLTVDAPSFSDSSKRTTKDLNSEDHTTAGYDQFGVYTEHNDDNQGSFSMMVPSGQSTAGVAVTGSDGSLSASGGAGTVDVNTPTGFPDAAMLDSEVNPQSGDNLILVGGPAVNSLTQQLADAGKTWQAGNYTEGEGIVQHVNNAFTQGQNALVVAGYSGEDTRAAANYIANYADHQQELAGKDMVTVSTQ